MNPQFHKNIFKIHVCVKTISSKCQKVSSCRKGWDWGGGGFEVEAENYCINLLFSCVLFILRFFFSFFFYCILDVFPFTFSPQSPKQLQVWQIDSRTSHRVRLQSPTVLWFLSPLPKCVEYLLARFTLDPREQIGALQRPQQKANL